MRAVRCHDVLVKPGAQRHLVSCRTRAGACPPKSPRVRDTWWWAALSHEAHKAYMQELYAKGRRPPPQHMGGGLYKSRE